ncbi:MAG: hypothetical protein WC869_00215 [Phycisphaerae bacterium]|jgi:hypothetical protein
MSQTTTALATNALSMAFERIESIFENLVDELHSKTLNWGLVDVDLQTLQTDDPNDLIADIRRAATTKWTLSRLIRTRPEALPPERLKYDSLFVSVLIKLGDAVSLDDISNAVADLRTYIRDSSWDFDAPLAVEEKKEPNDNDGLGFSSDLGEVSPGPDEGPPPAQVPAP